MLTIILVVLTILMCIGRVLALVHTPLDVIGGVAIAAFGALWYLQPSDKLVAKTTRKKSKKAI
jgi:membrane-associated phospholipid phosphatase